MRKVLLASALGGAIAAGGGGLALEALSPASKGAAPFIEPVIAYRSTCSQTDGRLSRRAFFLRVGLAEAQARAGETGGDLLPAETLAMTAYPISTEAEQAQIWFDHGLAYTFNFNHAAAIDAFRRAQAADPDCAMCYWGEAFALGPNINAAMEDAAAAPAHAAAQRALELSGGTSETEQALISAIVARYAAQAPADRAALDAAFADAMETASRRFPADDLVAVVAAEANMDSQPWAYWDVTGRVAEGRTERTLELLETVLERRPDYPPAIHLYIHITEASTDPYRAARHADRLAELVPELGHLVHMPSHTYFRIGRWEQSLQHNIDAVAADAAFLASHEASPLYEYGYYVHNIHFALTSAQMGGDGETALEMATLLDEKLPAEMAGMQPWIQPIKAAPYYATAQFDTPEAALELPDPGDEFPFLQAAWRYARGKAFIRLGQSADARAEAAEIGYLAANSDWSGLDAGGIPAGAVLEISRQVLLGRAAAWDGEYDAALDRLEDAVALQEALPYFEPPLWYYPVKQTLAAIALQAGQAERAEQLFLETLTESPNNAYALYGLQMAYRIQGQRAGRRHARALFRDAWMGPRRQTPELSRL